MVGRLRNRQLESHSGRDGLSPSSGDTYWQRLEANHYFGYYKPKKGAGTWWARIYSPETRKSQKKSLGAADDVSKANGTTVLDYKQAKTLAEKWFKECEGLATQLANGDLVHNGPYTVGAVLDVYFDDCARRGVKGLKTDMGQAAAWIRPELGHLEVSKLSRTRIEAWHAKVSESPKKVRQKDPPKPGQAIPKPRNFKIPRPPKPHRPAPKAPETDEEKRARRDTANRILTILKAALNHALDRKLVTNGDAWKATKPFKGTTKARSRFLTPEEQVRLVNACQVDFRRLVKGALHTGGRYGELTRATVQDFDPLSGTILLLGKGTGGGKPRKVVLTEEGQDFFREMTIDRQPGERIFLRDAVIRTKHQDRGLVWEKGEQVRLIRAACAAAGLEFMTFHELRHSYASMLVNAGCPLAYVAAQLGHSDTRMVEQHYGHIAKTDLAKAIRALMPKLGINEDSKITHLKVPEHAP